MWSLKKNISQVIYIHTKGPHISYQNVTNLLELKDMDTFCWKVNHSKKLTIQWNWLYMVHKLQQITDTGEVLWERFETITQNNL